MIDRNVTCTSSLRIDFNFTDMQWRGWRSCHSNGDVLSKQSRTTEEGNTSSLGNTEATATQGIGDTIITGCWTCVTSTRLFRFYSSLLLYLDLFFFPFSFLCFCFHCCCLVFSDTLNPLQFQHLALHIHCTSLS